MVSTTWWPFAPCQVNCTSSSLTAVKYAPFVLADPCGPLSMLSLWRGWSSWPTMNTLLLAWLIRWLALGRVRFIHGDNVFQSFSWIFNQVFPSINGKAHKLRVIIATVSSIGRDCGFIATQISSPVPPLVLWPPNLKHPLWAAHPPWIVNGEPPSQGPLCMISLPWRAGGLVFAFLVLGFSARRPVPCA